MIMWVGGAALEPIAIELKHKRVNQPERRSILATTCQPEKLLAKRQLYLTHHFKMQLGIIVTACLLFATNAFATMMVTNHKAVTLYLN